MQTQKEKVVVVTGASRGVGKGIALGLGESGATVYITGRTTEADQKNREVLGSIHQTAAEVSALGGKCSAIACDHRDDQQVEAAFQHILAEAGRIDVLVNNAWGGYEAMVNEQGEYTWEQPFWLQPMWRWDAMFQAGVRASYLASRCVANSMITQGSGLIINVSFWSAQKYMANVAYGVSKAATDKMTSDMAHELRPYHVAVVSLYPGLVRTEAVMRFAEYLDMHNSESPQFVGRSVSALISDPNILQKSGHFFVTAALASEFGFTDIDGSVPQAATLETA